MRTRAVTVTVYALAMLIASAFGARAQEQTYAYGGPSGAYVPGRTIVAEYWVWGPQQPKTLSVAVYALPLDTAVDAVLRQRLDDRMDVKGLHRVAVVEGTRDPDQLNRWHVELPALPIGYYTAVASAGKTTQSSIFDVTTLGVVANAVGTTRSMFAVDLRTFNRHVGPTEFSFVSGTSVRSIQADTGGLASLSVTRDAGNARQGVVAKTADGSVNVLALYQSGGERGDLGFIQTDRPIYRPGQTIDVRAIVREGSIGAYTVPTGTRRVKVTAPDGSLIYDHARPLSTFGTVDAAVRLPQDAQLGYYGIQIGTLSGGVSVQAYKKPEYEIAFAPKERYVVGGDRATFALSAQYFFGRPAAGMHLHYVAYKEPRFILYEGPYRFATGAFMPPIQFRRVKIAEGDFVTDGNGRHDVALGTEKTDHEQTIQMEADGRDASGRTVQVTAVVDVVPASFRIGLSTSAWFAQVGKATTVSVSTRSYEGSARANVPVNVEIVGSRWDEKARKSVDFSHETRSVTTDAKGVATFDWTPAKGGSYRFVATANDERGNVAHGYDYLWALGPGQESYFAPIENPVVIPEKSAYAPGERPRVLITLPKPGRDALVFVTTDRLISQRVVHLTGTTMALNVSAPKDASQFNVTVQLPNENGVSTATATIAVKPPPKALRVTIVPSKAKYAPGERARFDVLVRDARGNPARAELGIGVVDEAIYSVQAAPSTTPLDALYGGLTYAYPQYSWFRPNQGRSTIAKVSSGVVGDEYGVPARKLELNALATHRASETVRTNFQDTAYWAPSVVTNDKGEASISFVWPDNLTTWRATGVAVTRSTDVGESTAKALVTKDFLVRLETTRFLRAGDRSQIVGIAHGVAASPNARLQLQTSAESFVQGPLDVALHLDDNSMASTAWPVQAPGVGSVLLTLSGDDGSRTDAMRTSLPLLAGTPAEHVRDAGSLPNDSSLRIDVPPGYVAGDLHVTLSPSIVAELVQNVRLLGVYPYYCTEQTMSAALPAVFIGRVLARAHLPQPGDLSTERIVRDAVARLAQLQHPDGSWGWWEYDPAHPFMTAYAMYGLAEFRKAGYDVPQEMYERGLHSLVAQLATANTDTLRFWGGAQRDSEWNTRAFMLFALADASPKSVDAKLLEQTRAHATQLNPYALAVLGLAEHQLGNDDAARDLLAKLDARAIDDGAFTYWRGETWHYAWEDDPIETTAYALRLEAALNPHSPRIARVVNFLRAQRRGSWWYTTKDTAAAIYALSQTIAPDSSEFSPDETVRVAVDGNVVRTLHISHPVLDAADAAIVVPASELHDGSTVTFEREGRGALYWSSDDVRYVPQTATRASDAAEPLLARLFARAPDFRITRSYDVGHPGPWRVGDVATVDVTVTSRDDVQYVLIEDPFPAGAEHQPEQGRAADDAWSGVQLLDDHAAFFATRMYAGEPLRIRYTLRVTTPGTYIAPAPTANAMYGPPVSSVGDPTTVTVVGSP